MTGRHGEGVPCLPCCHQDVVDAKLERRTEPFNNRASLAHARDYAPGKLIFLTTNSLYFCRQIFLKSLTFANTL
jgi:hypothetical protein